MPQPMTTPELPIMVIAPARSVPRRMQAVWRYRELLVGLIRKELKVKYKDSSLGFFWSMLNPAMYLAVFYVVFQVILGSGIPYFAIYLLSGLLAWNLFSGSLTAATGSIVNNGSLVNKVYFPREILPLASVGANCVHFVLQGLVLVAALVGFRFEVDWGYLWLVVPAVVALLLITSAAAVFLSAANVYARDTQHFLELALLAWFWMTPIVYQWDLQASQIADGGRSPMLTLLNPMTPIVLALQRSLYGITTFVDPNGSTQRIIPLESSLWYARNLLVVALVGFVLLLLALRMFTRVEGTFSEEL